MNTGRVAIAGVGESDFARASELSLGQLVVQASRRAIADAGLRPNDIDGFVRAGSDPTVDQLAAALGAESRTFAAATEYSGGAGTVGAAELARLAIQNGLAKRVLVYYGFKGSQEGGPYAWHAEDPAKVSLEMPMGWYGQPVYFGAWAERYRATYGLAPEQLGEVALAARAWARLTPGAMRTSPLDMASYLAGPVIASPLRAADCCLISDAAGAVVITGADVARDLPHAPVLVAGVGVSFTTTTQSSFFTQRRGLPALGAGESGAAALEDSGLRLADMDFAQIYDCFTISTILQLEELGFCGSGEGAAYVEGGAIAPGGRFPVNTHGGHLSYAYVPGLNHVIEAVRQIRGGRGEGQLGRAEAGIVAGLGGCDHASLVLTTDR